MGEIGFKKFLKRLKYFLLQKIYPEPTKDQIMSLIENLRPVSTDKELIRLGGEYDGGYLLPDDLLDIEACFSPGVGTKSSFEKECADLGMQIFMADASVNGPAVKDDRFSFISKFIGGKNQKDFITLEKWISTVNISPDKDLLLQMDIEGHEYQVLKQTPVELLKRFRIIIIEFHRLGAMGSSYFYQENRDVFKKLNLNHKCVHIHPNNCCGINNLKGIETPIAAEFTFLRKDRISSEQKIESMPNPLDRDNVRINKTLVLPEFWYSEK
ncbi:FkbM family methyltransferase [Christiangramia salexigens]|uniref:Methyltransferase FkbM domain-containing protein n=1 Tax=Christiangramia salexigens TaxID=1913577 RepID=A0A1L3J4U3_9FLAO|nr:FkbM family methyltransferase [Christiangramia salexigens]APG60124.1 hypothetical protein LPB144_06705 [Christiangramia salexigens]